MALSLDASARAASAGPSPVPSPPKARPVVELILDVDPPDLFIANALERHLNAELNRRGIDLIVGTAAPRIAITEVRLRVDHPPVRDGPGGPGGPTRAVIQIHDGITDKLVERTIDLSKLPMDTRPLAVASSTDELLRASWVELSVSDAPAPAMAPPPEVLRAVAESLVPAKSKATAAPPRSNLELGLLFVDSFFPARLEALGGAGVFRGSPLPRLAAWVELGALDGLSRSGANGKVRAEEGIAAVGLSLTLSPTTGPLGIDVDLGVALLPVQFDSTASPGAQSHPTLDWAAGASGGISAWLRTDRVRWRLSGSALFIVRPARGEDDGTVVTGVEGVGAQLALGATFAL